MPKDPKSAPKKSDKKSPTKAGAKRKADRKSVKLPKGTVQPAATAAPPAEVAEFLAATATPAGYRRRQLDLDALRARLIEHAVRPTVPLDDVLESVRRIRAAPKSKDRLREGVKESVRALKPSLRRFHGAKIPLYWFPIPWLVSKCGDRFGYMSSKATRSATRLPFTPTVQALLGKLGDMMGDPGQDPNPLSHDSGDAGVSTIPAGFTYFGQFVDHDVTLDVSSSLDTSQDANTVPNMRSPALDLDSVYGRGPGLDPFLYDFPTVGPPTAIKMQLGRNTASGPGGPASGSPPGGLITLTDFDVPRVLGSNTAIIGDPRNDENLIVSQFHHAMLRFHNAIVDLLVAASFSGDIFAEAKRIATHHYQWAVVNDFLETVCGGAAVSAAKGSVSAAIGSHFRMPVEFAVAAYRFGHSMIRDRYWINANFPQATLAEVFEFSRNPRLPVFSNWIVDFNAFFDTGFSVPVNNRAREIDSALATGLEFLPGFSGLMARLATRNLRRGLALGLPSGQGMADEFGVAPLTTAELTTGLPAAEVTLLESNAGLLLKKTPLWYYILREAAVKAGGNRLGPVGARIVAETFVRILKRDVSSYLNVSGGFTPMLPSAVSGDFTVGDLVGFAGVTRP